MESDERPPLVVGAAELDITPLLGVRIAGGFSPVYATDVHDPLRAKAVVIGDGKVKVAFVALDVIALSLSDVEAIRSQVQQATGIAPHCVMVGCTHTHSGPATQTIHEVEKEEAYVAWLIRRVADAVRLADRRLRPARVAWGRGEQHDISFCRRYRMRDGTVRMNPGRGNPDIVEPTSPIDPTVGVLYAEDLDGRPIAVVAQFGMHYVGTDERTAISADYYGHFAAHMRRALGDGCTPLLLNGALGQVNNVNPFDEHQDRGHARGRRIAGALAGEVLKVIGRARRVAACPLDAATAAVELPKKTITPEDVEVARAILAGRDPRPGSGPFSHVVGEPIPDRLRPVFARHVLRLAQMPSSFRTEVQVVRVGDSAWIGLPGQTFTELSLAIAQRSPAPYNFVVNLANDNLGYIATDRALLHEGGYETWAAPSNPVGVGAEGITVKAAVQLLNQLFGAGAGRQAG